MGFYTEAAKQLNNSNITPIDMPTFLYECAQTEQQLFEGLIELDFAQVYSESGVITLTEADKEAAQDASDKAIADASKNIFQRFLDAIKKVFDKVSAALIDFFNGTKSLVAKKLNNPRAKSCQIKDVWFSDYKKLVVALENQCKESLNFIPVITDANGTELVEDLKVQSKCICDLLGNLIGIIPTTKEGVENAENKKAFLQSVKERRNELKEIAGGHVGKTAFTRNFANLLNVAEGMYDDLKPKELGGIDMTALTKEISVGGAGSNIKAIFELLKKPEPKLDDEGKKVKEKTALTVSLTKVRLALFTSYTKGCLNTAKIARRNYAVISKYISGKVLNPGEAENANESAAYYGSMSDLFCEQVFGF